VKWLSMFLNTRCSSIFVNYMETNSYSVVLYYGQIYWKKQITNLLSAYIVVDGYICIYSYIKYTTDISLNENNPWLLSRNNTINPNKLPFENNRNKT